MTVTHSDFHFLWTLRLQSTIKQVTDNTTLQTNLNDMSGAPVVLISGGTLPASEIVVNPSPYLEAW